MGVGSFSRERFYWQLRTRAVIMEQGLSNTVIAMIEPRNLEEICTLIIVFLQWFVIFLLGNETYGAYCKFRRLRRLEQSVLSKIFQTVPRSNHV